MPKNLRSFLVRCWQLGDDQIRIEIEHIQSGDKVLVESIDAALDWIGAQPHAARNADVDLNDPDTM